jgi:predicted alpha/beta-hydrolase family hydrolase
MGLLLAPGAGADRDQPTLVAIDKAATEAGLVVVRMDFPYRQAGRRAPDRPAVLVQAVKDQASLLARQVDAIVLGGRSLGGRMCSMAEAGGLRAAGLVLISYPLHPPGRLDQPRTEHFPSVSAPCLFVSGTRDTFASTDELEAATRTIPGPVTHYWLDGQGHALRGHDQEIASVVVQWVERLSPRRRRSRKA